MKKIFFLLALFISAKYLTAQIPNSDMELWNAGPTLAEWQTNSRPFTLPPYDPYVVKQDSDSYSGHWAADLWGNGVFKPWALTTFPVSSHPVSLSLYYKLLFPACVNDSGYAVKDTASVLVELLNQGNVVDQGYWESIISNFNYSQLVVPLSQSAIVFDSCRITFMGGMVYGGCGFAAANTEFKIDHIELNYLTTADRLLSGEEGQFSIFPNPTTGTTELRLALGNASVVDISIHNLVGEVLEKFIQVRGKAGNNNYPLNVDRLASGTYLVEIRLNNSLTAVRKLVKL